MEYDICNYIMAYSQYIVLLVTSGNITIVTACGDFFIQSEMAALNLCNDQACM